MSSLLLLNESIERDIIISLITGQNYKIITNDNDKAQIFSPFQSGEEKVDENEEKINMNNNL